MATFIHIFAESDCASIKRSGIRMQKTSYREYDGVFLSPVTSDYYFTHQWARELKRFENVPKLAARVRIPDTEKVWVGRYNEPHDKLSAAEAIRFACEQETPRGLEVILPRKVSSKEIIAVYRPNRNTGWRFFPESNGEKPLGYPEYQRGEPYSRKLRLED